MNSFAFWLLVLHYKKAKGVQSTLPSFSSFSLSGQGLAWSWLVQQLKGWDEWHPYLLSHARLYLESSSSEELPLSSGLLEGGMSMERTNLNVF